MFTLPPLPYAYEALEPWIDAETMRIHHGKHHQAYVDNLNKALEPNPQYTNLTIEQLLNGLNELPEEIKTKVRNNGGGYYNHSLFWQIMCSEPENQAVTKEFSKLTIYKELIKTFISFEKFQEQFSNAGLARFGSGWVWLAADKRGNLSIIDTPNQDNPLMPDYQSTDHQYTSLLLGLDVWEHAYYLKYQNRRAEYIKNWWNVVNWSEAERAFLAL